MAHWSYTDCGLPGYPLLIQSITSTPDSLRPGSEWKATIKAVAQEEIKDGAYLGVMVKLGLVKLLQRRYDLFEALRGGDVSGWTLTTDAGVADGSTWKGPVGADPRQAAREGDPPGQVLRGRTWLHPRG
ncbi:hypothetical protein ACIRU3_43625 [Streptomyces sp. NPDC101151]|uniref:hypothetical protein n=1 Tax=Streptomyces sp. NPDC101151 TaxID=3366115 RepID=UPI0038072FE7